MELLWVALVFGVVEGLTEFLPVSSTGHLIVTGELLDFGGARGEVFTIFIQLGAILSVVWEFRSRFSRTVTGFPRDPLVRRFVQNLALAFVPAALIGFAAHERITQLLFSPRTVAWALIAGGLAMLVVEALPLSARTHTTDAVTPLQAVAVGLAQCLALWPGFSRSAATILGGMSVGCDRRTATEFSFFLAVPTMVAATIFDLVHNWSALSATDLAWLALSFLVSFLVAWASIRWLLRWVATHSLAPFAWYRIGFGVLILLVLV